MKAKSDPLAAVALLTSGRAYLKWVYESVQPKTRLSLFLERSNFLILPFLLSIPYSWQSFKSNLI